MKYIIRVTFSIYVIFLFSSCATVFGGRVTNCQKTKPAPGMPSREIRVAALVADLFFFFPSVIVDFATGAIYKPCTSNNTSLNNQNKLEGNVEANNSTPIVTNPYRLEGNQYSKVIGNPIDLGTIVVAEFDFPEDLTYSEAKQKVELIGNGWRLPSKEEHQNIICPSKSRIPNLTHNKNYWSGTESNSYDVVGKVGVQGFNVFYKLMYLACDNGSWLNITANDGNKLRVRLVKSK